MIILIDPPDLPEGAAQVVRQNGRAFLICRTGEGFRVFAALCPHQGLSLEGARVRGGQVWCPHHGARFALDTGASMTPLTPKPLRVYACSLRNGWLEIDASDCGGDAGEAVKQS